MVCIAHGSSPVQPVSVFPHSHTLLHNTDKPALSALCCCSYDKYGYNKGGVYRFADAAETSKKN